MTNQSINTLTVQELFSIFNAWQVEEIVQGFKNGLTDEQIAVFAKPEFDSWQMCRIRTAFESGLTMEQVLTFAKPEFSWYKMQEIRLKLEQENNNK